MYIYIYIYVPIVVSMNIVGSSGRLARRFYKGACPNRRVMIRLTIE